PRQLAAMPILNWANSFKDADKVAELAAKMRARAEGDEAYGRLADGLEKMAKDLRAKG
ncbi:MAG: hypothetical protein H8D72_02075, partial [Planctomycetes bacterium]|nr:hypothetical protein [Planctomycetota bacterium]